MARDTMMTVICRCATGDRNVQGAVNSPHTDVFVKV